MNEWVTGHMLTFKHLKRRFINLSEEVSRAFPLCSVCCKVTNNFFSIRRLPTRPQQDFSQFSCSCWCSPLLSCSLLVPVGLLLHYPSTSLVVFLCFLFPPLAHIARLSVVCFPPSLLRVCIVKLSIFWPLHEQWKPSNRCMYIALGEADWNAKHQTMTVLHCKGSWSLTTCCPCTRFDNYWGLRWMKNVPVFKWFLHVSSLVVLHRHAFIDKGSLSGHTPWWTFAAVFNDCIPLFSRSHTHMHTDTHTHTPTHTHIHI